MADGRWNPFRDFLDLQNELMRTFERTMVWPYREASRVFERAVPPRVRAEGWQPAIETFRRDNDLVVRVELPGISAEDVEVTVKERTLTIRGERRHPEAVGADDLLTEEFTYGTFERQINLPEEARAEEIKASFQNGVLEVLVPQGATEGAKGRKVLIQSQPTG